MTFIKRNIIFSGLTGLVSVLYSCSVLEPAIPTSSYIHIDSVSLSTDYATQGSSSKKISDVWVIYDNEYLGTFPLPADIPLIGEGNHSLILKGGIVENGISATRAAYPKYNSYVTTVFLDPKIPVTVNPSVAYIIPVSFPQIEDFDDANLTMVPTTSGNVLLDVTQISDPNAFEGNSGHAVLDSAHTIFEVATATPFTLPTFTPTYLELNYKCGNDFSIGVFITTTSGITKSSLLSIRASDVWKKVYVTLSTLGGVVSGGIDYKIFLHAEKDPVVSKADLYFDNLKVVY